MIAMHSRWTLLLPVTLLLTAMGLAADLPSEATLPGAAQRPRGLPPESALPATAGQVLSSPSDQRRLPSEGTLPASQSGSTEVAQGPADPRTAEPPPGKQGIAAEKPVAQGDEPVEQLLIGKRVEDLPWLRLSVRGHTGMIRALAFSEDSARICSAGEDKAVEVWTRVAPDLAGGRNWLNERTIRWQVQRANRGHIYALAAGSNRLALAGHGAMGAAGEILVVDPATGELKRALYDEAKGHRQVVVSLSLASTPNGALLASSDAQGQTVLWREDSATGLWRAEQLCPPDQERYGSETAGLLASRRQFVPLVMAGTRSVIIPAYVKQQRFPQFSRPVCVWQLERRDLETQRVEPLDSKAVHFGMVMALAASADGTKLCSADMENLFIWDLAGTPGWKVQELPPGSDALALALSRDGTRLLMGTSNPHGLSLLQLWDVSRSDRPRRLDEKTVSDYVRAVALAPNGQTYAYSQANAVFVGNLSRNKLQEKEEVLQSETRPVLDVAFAAERPFYRIAFATRRQPDRSPLLERTFDLENVQFGQDPRINPRDWIENSWGSGGWSIHPFLESSGQTYWLFQGEQRRARLPLRREMGTLTAKCWVPDPKGNPFAVAVGMVGTKWGNDVCVFRLAQGGEAPLVRQFRGHTATVRSLGVSREFRYLVSGSDDATICVWNLAGLTTEDELENRWGAAFEVRGGRLVATFVREDGPLFFRGIRQEDVLESLAWHDGTQVRKADQPESMLAALQEVPWDTLMVFSYRRGDLSQPGFQLFPAWQPLASLFVAGNRQWAFWTPAGFYDASFDGHRLFGWQVNRGLSILPDFFLAAQLRKSLERPEVMRKLLEAGSLSAAFRLARLLPPANPQESVLSEYRLKPRVQILSPKANDVVTTPRVTIQAAITVRNGLQLVPPKAFANGVVAGNRRVIAERSVAEGREVVYAWESRLPAEPRILVQVVAATDAENADSQTVTIHRSETPATPLRRMYVVAVGVNEYRDAQIQRLEYAVNNARRLVDVLRQGAGQLYGSDATMLLNERATRSLWTVVTQQYAERLKQEVGPDDLLVLFLSGHGVRDSRTQKYYYVAANARYADVKSERFDDCLSFDDFAALADVPCRKLVILDTCHSGAVQQPLRQQDLKAAIRSLETDVVLTLTASEGDQEAVEQRERQLGRFTARLIEALEGAADQTARGGDGNGIVTLSEAIRYVSDLVRADSAKDAEGHMQAPTAGPLDLLEYVQLPLTQPQTRSEVGG